MRNGKMRLAGIVAAAMLVSTIGMGCARDSAKALSAADRSEAAAAKAESAAARAEAAAGRVEDAARRAEAAAQKAEAIFMKHMRK